MRTLPMWIRRFSSTPTEIACSAMHLYGFADHEAPIFAGAGALHLDTPSAFRFLMHARPGDPSDAFRRLVESDRSPYDVQRAFRLLAVDYEGIRWNCGWTRPRIQSPSRSGTELLLTGELSRLSTEVEGDQAAAESGVEAAYNPAPRVPLGETLVTTATIGDKEVGWRHGPGRHECKVLGSTIEISHDPWAEDLWLVATTSDQLNHPFLENWVSEPLRVLCGQLVYPRFLARNLGGGRALVDVRPSLPLHSRLGGCAATLGSNDPQAFWGFYERYLAYLAKSRGPDGYPIFESNPITRFQEEVIQAADGSRWMLALAVASAIEGISRLAAEPGGLPREFDENHLASVREYLERWQGNDEIRQRLLSYLVHLGQPSVDTFLQRLVGSSIIKAAQRDAWLYVRNRVTHGVLGDPWPDEASDERLRSLVELLYAMTIWVVDSAWGENS